MVKGIVNSLTGGSSGGTKCYVANESGIEINKGDKVLVNWSSNDNNIYSDPIRASYFKGFSYCLESGEGVFISEYDSAKTFVEETNGSLKTTNLNYSKKPDLRLPYVISKGEFRYKVMNSNKMAYQGLTSSLYVESDYFEVANGIWFNTSDRLLYSTDKALTYDTGFGDFINSQYMIQGGFGNNVVITNTDGITLIDVTDFPNCVKTFYPLEFSVDRNCGVTGIEDGDYFIGTKGFAVCFFKLVGNKFIYDFEVSLPSNNNDYKENIFVDLYQKTVCIIDSNFEPCLYVYNDGKMEKKNIPQEIFGKIRDIVKTNNYTKAYFSMNRYMTGFTLTTGVDANNIYGYIGKGFNLAIKDNSWLEYNPIESYTGFATGNVDENGKVEVEMKLPDKVGLTIVTNVDVANDEIIFEGME